MASSSMSGGGRRPASLFPWLVPQPRPEPEPESEVTSVTPMVNIVSSNPSQPATTHPQPAQQTSPPSQSSGQAPGSKSDEQGSAGSSQAEASTDADQAKDETRAQVALRDIAEVQDDFGTSWVFDGISPDHWHRYNNPDVIRVQQDMEQRPLIFKRCFEQAESPRSALEFIYADCPVTDESELRHLEQVAQDQSDIRAGMAEGSTGDARNGVQETFTLDDVRQFIQIDLKTETFNGDDAALYEKMLEDVFGYEIDFKDRIYGYSAEEKIMQLKNLAEANLHIVSYLDDVFVNDTDTSGLSVFQESFGQTEQGTLRVHLGDDHELKDETYGFVPFWGSNTDKVYLGSAVNIATIVHEFGHVLDRNVDMVTYLQTPDAPGEEARLMDGAGPYRVGLGELILTSVIEGFAAKQRDDKEVWADLFMTAVLHGKGETVYSLVRTSLSGVWTTGEEVICGQEGVVCDWREVGWRLSPHGDLTNNAKAVRDKLLALLPQKL